MATSHQQPTLTGSHAPDSLERRTLRNFFSSQYRVLMHRYTDEDFISVRTLASFHQQAAQEAKRGHLHTARIQMDALDGLQPATKELSLVCQITAQPAWALIDWKEAKFEEALRRLRLALTACAELAMAYSHNYLTPKRIYLASHVARVHFSKGDAEKASDLVEALIAVANGAALRWPFDGLNSLDLPVNGDEGLILNGQLLALRSRLNVALTFDAPTFGGPG
jgi:hypothetical protein